MESVVKSVLCRVSSVNRAQAKFIVSVLAVLLVFQGKANFRNLSRYCEMSEKRFSRWYRRGFDFVAFNQGLLETALGQGTGYIAAMDASFMGKSGQQTEGLGWFYHGGSGRAQRGLELSLVCVIDLKANTAYSLDARQTLDSTDETTTRVTHYAEQLTQVAPCLKALGIDHVAADAYYSKVAFVDAVCGSGLALVGKLRLDAHLQWLYEGAYSGKGRPRKYAGKVDIHTQLDRFDAHDDLDAGIAVYSKTVWVKAFKRKVKVVLLRWTAAAGKIGHALLFSTDLSLDAHQIIRYYKARFQIEFLFRDSKQFTGLMDCQARCKEAIHTPINVSLTALNLLKLEDRRVKGTHTPTVISIASWRRKKSNEHLMDRLFERLGLDRGCEKVAQAYEEFRHYGVIAA